MSHTLNSLTAQLLAGQITCGAYADAVHALQHGEPSAPAPYTNPCGPAFDAECAERGISTGLSWTSVEGRDENENEDENERGCSDCGRLVGSDYLFECGDCGEQFCENCLEVVDIVDAYGNPMAVDAFCRNCHVPADRE